MRRLWLRWLGLLLFVIACVVAFINLGNWQLHRLDERKEMNDSVSSHAKAAPVEAGSVMRDGVNRDDEWRHVTATGTYLADRQLIVRYRNLRGAPGFEVVTPLQTSSGIILVNRGFIQIPQTQAPVAPPPPSGEVTVTGFVQRNQHGPDNALFPENGNIRLINSPVISRRWGLDMLDGYVVLATSAPAQQGDLRPLGLPEQSEGPHFSYALQWFAFTLLAVAGLFIFIRSDLRDRKKERERAARKEQAAAAEQEAPDTTPSTSPSGASVQESSSSNH